MKQFDMYTMYKGMVKDFYYLFRKLRERYAKKLTSQKYLDNVNKFFKDKAGVELQFKPRRDLRGSLMGR